MTTNKYAFAFLWVSYFTFAVTFFMLSTAYRGLEEKNRKLEAAWAGLYKVALTGDDIQWKCSLALSECLDDVNESTEKLEEFINYLEELP